MNEVARTSRVLLLVASAIGAVLIVSIPMVVTMKLRAHARNQVMTLKGAARLSLLYNSLSRSLRAGMTKEQVQGITGLPDNEDTRYVWIWNCDEETIGASSPVWSAVYLRSRRNAYLLFDDDGRLLCPSMIRAIDGDPWERFQHYAHDYSNEFLERRLGRKPS